MMREPSTPRPLGDQRTAAPNVPPSDSILAGRRVAIVTFGCRVNQYESAMMARTLSLLGAEVVDDAADVVILNACTVTALAERKARQAARQVRAAGPAAVVLIGCLADAVERGVTRFAEADLIAGNCWKARVGEVVAAAIGGRRGLLPRAPLLPLDAERAAAPTARVRAYLKVQEGCAHACTYCRPTLVRGPSRSKSLAVAFEEAAELVRSGVPEIVVTGVDLAAYGDSTVSLPTLLGRLLELPDLRRLRIASLNVDGVTDRLLEVFRRDSRLCRHLHIPAQSGDDAVLAAMGRRYTTTAYRAAIERAREALPQATFGTDLMVGFPGETEEAFDHTCRLVEDVRFSNLHVFRFSPRPGTPAAAFADAVPSPVQRSRAGRVLDAWRPGLGRLLDGRIGTVEDVLVEDRSGGRYHGYTSDYIRVAFDSPTLRPIGRECPVRIARAAAEGLEGVSEDRDDPD
ncbi:MAG: MiaB/RimO family radical SAM methylthiotransferase [Candidatus Bipolaricaulis sp.]|nr:MiaB/RimO family radical SAM methylthiotransferase [Candidatus Bipolaricaulis sp.]